MKIKIKKLAENFIMPIKGDSTSACYDCYATSRKYDEKRGIWIYGLGFATEPPVGYSIELHPRSSVDKTGLVLCNSTGIIDNQYRGEIMAKFLEAGGIIKPYEVGERVCQIKLVKDLGEELELVDKLSETERGDGGFGSTGLK